VAMEQMSEDAVAYYARRAVEYEPIYAKPERQANLVEMRDRLRDTFANRHVLEFACGTGFWTESISERARSVLATDINEEMLQIARAKDWQGRPVTFGIAEAFDPESIPGRFDAAFVGFLWSHIELEDMTTFLSRLNRRLPSGALVVFIDNRFVAGSSTPISRTDEAGNTYQMRTLADGSRHEILKNFPEESELLAVTRKLSPPVADASVEAVKHFWMLSYYTPGGEQVTRR